MPRRQLGMKNIIVVTISIRHIKGSENEYPAIRFVRGGIIKADIPETTISNARVFLEGNLSATLPPKYAPMLMPAKITPIIDVQV